MDGQEFLSGLLVGLVVILGISGTVEATSHDVGWTFGNVSSSSYRLDASEPDDAGLGANLGAQDPTLTLQIGKRYQVAVTNFVPHPLEVLAKGASAGADTILLAQGPKTGPFESDPQVAWVDDGSGTVTFTLTSALHDAMMGSNEDFRQMVKAVAAAKLRLVIDSVAPLESITDAMGKMEAAEQFGKIVLEVSR